MRPLKFNKCLSNLKRESERMCERNQLTSNPYYVRDATDPPGSRGARGRRGRWWGPGGRVGERTLGGGARAVGIGASRGVRVGSAGVGRVRGFWFLPRPPKRCQRVRRPAAQQACALSRFFVPFLAYQKHESDRPRIYPWCSTARRYNAVRIFVRENKGRPRVRARAATSHTAQPSGK